VDATLVVVAVHSHVKLDAYVPLLRQKLGHPHTVLVAMPCCVDQSMEAPLAPEAGNSSAPGLAAATGGSASGTEAPLPGAAAAAASNVTGGWTRTARKKRGGQGAKKRRLVHPTREYHDYGVHSNERVVRVFVLRAGGEEAAAEAAAAAAVEASAEEDV
jgi:hypothetical protein